jgi:hypothetical protein
MKRNGFWPPAGEVDYSTSTADQGQTPTGVSTIVDVAIGEEGTWSIIDSKRQRIYTYDSNGNLLFAFGDKGQQLGNIASIQSACYQVVNGQDYLLLLDKSDKSFTVFSRTEYGDILINALKHENERKYNLSKDDWEEVLKRNSNFDEAYIGIGKSLYQEGRYEESLVYYKAAYDTANYSKSYEEIRKAWIAQNIIWIPIIVVAICLFYTFIFKAAAKINYKATYAKRKKTFWEEIVYAFHVIFHPFDGFWDLKHEKRGSIRASLVFLGLTVVTFFYQAIGQGYLANPRGSFTTILAQLLGVVVPLALWVIANWCLTTLFEGEGSMKDIFIATCYSLLPLILLIIPATIATNFMTVTELNVSELIVNASFIWMGILLFVGTLVTHDYSIFKNVVTCLATIVGMVFIMFVGILFSTLLGKIVGFISDIIMEINYRL